MIVPRFDIAFASCQTSPNDKISRLKVKPLRINDLEQGILLQLCCLVGSNFSNSFSLLSLASPFYIDKVYFLVSVWSWPKCFSFEISCALSLALSSDLDRFDANNWSFFHWFDFLATMKEMLLVFKSSTDENSEFSIKHLYNYPIKLRLFFIQQA